MGKCSQEDDEARCTGASDRRQDSVASEAHRGNLRCPVMWFRDDEYIDTVASCHGSGFSSHQRLNEHLKRTHVSTSISTQNLRTKNKRKPAPLLNNELVVALQKSGQHKKNTRTKEEIQEKWWTTVEMLDLGTRPKVLEADVSHLASPTDKIRRVFRSGRGSGPSKGLNPSMTTSSTPKDAEEVFVTSDHTMSPANQATARHESRYENKDINREVPHEKSEGEFLKGYENGYENGYQDGLRGRTMLKDLTTVDQELGHTSMTHDVLFQEFCKHYDSGIGSMDAHDSPNDMHRHGDGDGDGQGHSGFCGDGNSPFVEPSHNQFNREDLPAEYAETVELDDEDGRAPGTG